MNDKSTHNHHFSQTQQNFHPSTISDYQNRKVKTNSSKFSVYTTSKKKLSQINVDLAQLEMKFDNFQNNLNMLMNGENISNQAPSITDFRYSGNSETRQNTNKNQLLFDLNDFQQQVILQRPKRQQQSILPQNQLKNYLLTESQQTLQNNFNNTRSRTDENFQPLKKISQRQKSQQKSKSKQKSTSQNVIKKQNAIKNYAMRNFPMEYFDNVELLFEIMNRKKNRIKQMHSTDGKNRRNKQKNTSEDNIKQNQKKIRLKSQQNQPSQLIKNQGRKTQGNFIRSQSSNLLSVNRKLSKQTVVKKSPDGKIITLKQKIENSKNSFIPIQKSILQRQTANFIGQQQQIKTQRNFYPRSGQVSERENSNASPKTNSQIHPKKIQTKQGRQGQSWSKQQKQQFIRSQRSNKINHSPQYVERNAQIKTADNNQKRKYYIQKSTNPFNFLTPQATLRNTKTDDQDQQQHKRYSQVQRQNQKQIKASQFDQIGDFQQKKPYAINMNKANNKFPIQIKKNEPKEGQSFLQKINANHIKRRRYCCCCGQQKDQQQSYSKSPLKQKSLDKRSFSKTPKKSQNQKNNDNNKSMNSFKPRLQQKKLSKCHCPKQVTGTNTKVQNQSKKLHVQQSTNNKQESNKKQKSNISKTDIKQVSKQKPLQLPKPHNFKAHKLQTATTSTNVMLKNSPSKSIQYTTQKIDENKIKQLTSNKEQIIKKVDQQKHKPLLQKRSLSKSSLRRLSTKKPMRSQSQQNVKKVQKKEIFTAPKVQQFLKPNVQMTSNPNIKKLVRRANNNNVKNDNNISHGSFVKQQQRKSSNKQKQQKRQQKNDLGQKQKQRYDQRQNQRQIQRQIPVKGDDNNEPYYQTNQTNHQTNEQAYHQQQTNDNIQQGQIQQQKHYQQPRTSFDGILQQIEGNLLFNKDMMEQDNALCEQSQEQQEEGQSQLLQEDEGESYVGNVQIHRHQQQQKLSQQQQVNRSINDHNNESNYDNEIAIKQMDDNIHDKCDEIKNNHQPNDQDDIAVQLIMTKDKQNSDQQQMEQLINEGVIIKRKQQQQRLDYKEYLNDLYQRLVVVNDYNNSQVDGNKDSNNQINNKNNNNNNNNNIKTNNPTHIIKQSQQPIRQQQKSNINKLIQTKQSIKSNKPQRQSNQQQSHSFQNCQQQQVFNQNKDKQSKQQLLQSKQSCDLNKQGNQQKLEKSSQQQQKDDQLIKNRIEGNGHLHVNCADNHNNNENDNNKIIVQQQIIRCNNDKSKIDSKRQTNTNHYDQTIQQQHQQQQQQQQNQQNQPQLQRYQHQHLQHQLKPQQKQQQHKYNKQHKNSLQKQNNKLHQQNVNKDIQTNNNNSSDKSKSINRSIGDDVVQQQKHLLINTIVKEQQLKQKLQEKQKQLQQQKQQQQHYVIVRPQQHQSIGSQYQPIQSQQSQQQQQLQYPQKQQLQQKQQQLQKQQRLNQLHVKQPKQQSINSKDVSNKHNNHTQTIIKQFHQLHQQQQQQQTQCLQHQQITNHHHQQQQQQQLTHQPNSVTNSNKYQNNNQNNKLHQQSNQQYGYQVQKQSKKSGKTQQYIKQSSSILPSSSLQPLRTVNSNSNPIAINQPTNNNQNQFDVQKKDIQSNNKTANKQQQKQQKGYTQQNNNKNNNSKQSSISKQDTKNNAIISNPNQIKQNPTNTVIKDKEVIIDKQQTSIAILPLINTQKNIDNDIQHLNGQKSIVNYQNQQNVNKMMIQRKEKKEKALTNNGQMISVVKDNGKGFMTQKDNKKDQITGQLLIEQQKQQQKQSNRYCHKQQLHSDSNNSAINQQLTNHDQINTHQQQQPPQLHKQQLKLQPKQRLQSNNHLINNQQQKNPISIIDNNVNNNQSQHLPSYHKDNSQQHLPSNQNNNNPTQSKQTKKTIQHQSQQSLIQITISSNSLQFQKQAFIITNNNISNNNLYHHEIQNDSKIDEMQNQQLDDNYRDQSNEEKEEEEQDVKVIMSKNSDRQDEGLHKLTYGDKKQREEQSQKLPQQIKNKSVKNKIHSNDSNMNNNIDSKSIIKQQYQNTPTADMPITPQINNNNVLNNQSVSNDIQNIQNNHNHINNDIAAIINTRDNKTDDLNNGTIQQQQYSDNIFINENNDNQGVIVTKDIDVVQQYIMGLNQKLIQQNDKNDNDQYYGLLPKQRKQKSHITINANTRQCQQINTLSTKRLQKQAHNSNSNNNNTIITPQQQASFNQPFNKSSFNNPPVNLSKQQKLQQYHQQQQQHNQQIQKQPNNYDLKQMDNNNNNIQLTQETDTVAVNNDNNNITGSINVNGEKYKQLIKQQCQQQQQQQQQQQLLLNQQSFNNQTNGNKSSQTQIMDSVLTNKDGDVNKFGNDNNIVIVNEVNDKQNQKLFESTQQVNDNNRNSINNRVTQTSMIKQIGQSKGQLTVVQGKQLTTIKAYQHPNNQFLSQHTPASFNLVKQQQQQQLSKQQQQLKNAKQQQHQERVENITSENKQSKQQTKQQTITLSDQMKQITDQSEQQKHKLQRQQIQQQQQLKQQLKQQQQQSQLQQLKQQQLQQHQQQQQTQPINNPTTIIINQSLQTKQQPQQTSTTLLKQQTINNFMQQKSPKNNTLVVQHRHIHSNQQQQQPNKLTIISNQPQQQLSQQQKQSQQCPQCKRYNQLKQHNHLHNLNYQHHHFSNNNHPYLNHPYMYNPFMYNPYMNPINPYLNPMQFYNQSKGNNLNDNQQLEKINRKKSKIKQQSQYNQSASQQQQHNDNNDYDQSQHSRSYQKTNNKRSKSKNTNNNKSNIKSNNMGNKDKTISTTSNKKHQRSQQSLLSPSSQNDIDFDSFQQQQESNFYINTSTGQQNYQKTKRSAISKGKSSKIRRKLKEDKILSSQQEQQQQQGSQQSYTSKKQQSRKMSRQRQKQRQKQKQKQRQQQQQVSQFQQQQLQQTTKTSNNYYPPKPSSFNNKKASIVNYITNQQPKPIMRINLKEKNNKNNNVQQQNKLSSELKMALRLLNYVDPKNQYLKRLIQVNSNSDSKRLLLLLWLFPNQMMFRQQSTFQPIEIVDNKIQRETSMKCQSKQIVDFIIKPRQIASYINLAINKFEQQQLFTFKQSNMVKEILQIITGTAVFNIKSSSFNKLKNLHKHQNIKGFTFSNNGNKRELYEIIGSEEIERVGDDKGNNNKKNNQSLINNENKGKIVMLRKCKHTKTTLPDKHNNLKTQDILQLTNQQSFLQQPIINIKWQDFLNKFSHSLIGAFNLNYQLRSLHFVNNNDKQKLQKQNKLKRNFVFMMGLKSLRKEQSNSNNKRDKQHCIVNVNLFGAGNKLLQGTMTAMTEQKFKKMPTTEQQPSSSSPSNKGRILVYHQKSPNSYKYIGSGDLTFISMRVRQGNYLVILEFTKKTLQVIQQGKVIVNYAGRGITLSQQKWTNDYASMMAGEDAEFIKTNKVQ